MFHVTNKNAHKLKGVEKNLDYIENCDETTIGNIFSNLYK